MFPGRAEERCLVMVKFCPFYSGGKCHKKITGYKCKPKDKVTCRFTDHWRCPDFLESAVSYVEEQRNNHLPLISKKYKKKRNI